MKERWFRGYNYYWVVDQAEYATDLIFTSREPLAGLYSRLLDHAAIKFSAKDILMRLEWGRVGVDRQPGIPRGSLVPHCFRSRLARRRRELHDRWPDFCAFSASIATMQGVPIFARLGVNWAVP
jgi:hypothetical protein